MKKRAMLAGLLLAPAVAIACATIYMVTRPVEISSLDTAADQWRDIGDQLTQQFGSSLDGFEASLKVPISVCFLGACAPPLEQNFLKGCGETIKEATEALAQASYGASTGGGGGDPGDISFGGSSDPWADCVAATYTPRNCTTDWQGNRVCHTETMTLLECPT